MTCISVRHLFCNILAIRELTAPNHPSRLTAMLTCCSLEFMRHCLLIHTQSWMKSIQIHHSMHLTKYGLIHCAKVSLHSYTDIKSCSVGKIEYMSLFETAKYCPSKIYENCNFSSVCSTSKL